MGEEGKTRGGGGDARAGARRGGAGRGRARAVAQRGCSGTRARSRAINEGGGALVRTVEGGEQSILEVRKTFSILALMPAEAAVGVASPPIISRIKRSDVAYANARGGNTSRRGDNAQGRATLAQI